MKRFLRNRLVAFSFVLIMVSGLLAPALEVYAASGDTIVYVTKSGKKYHVDGCSSLSKSKIEITLSEAVKKYGPCSKCNPPLLDDADSGTTASANAVKPASNSTATAINASQQETEYTYVLKTTSKKIHYPTCKDVAKISAKNYATSSESKETLISQGYSSCGHCKP